MLGHSTVISGVAAYGKFVLTAGYDRRAILWDSATQKILGIGYHDNLVNQVRFSPNGKLALSTSSDYTARLWSLPDMQLVSVLNHHEDDVEAADFHPRSRVIATASFDDSIGLYDYDGRLLFHLRGHESDVNDVFWKDDRTLISTGDDGTIRHWDFDQRVQKSFVRITDTDIDSICNGPNDLIFCGDDDGDIVVLSAASVKEKFSAHQAGIKNIAYVAKMNLVISTSYDGLVKFWTVSGDGRFQLLSSSKLPNLVWPRSCAHLGGEQYVFSSFGSKYALLDRTADRWSIEGIVPSSSLNAATALDGRILAIGDAGKLVDMDATVRAEVGELCNTLHACGASLLTGGQSGLVWDLASGKPLYSHNSPINGGGDVLSTERGMLCALGTYTGEVLLFMSGGDTVARLHCKGRLSSGSVKDVALASNMSMAVVSNGQAVFFDTLSLKVVKVSDGHAAVANACVSVPGGFASVGRDRNLILWNSHGEILESVKAPHRHSIKSLCAVEDFLILGDYRGCISRFDLRTRRFTPPERVSEAGVSCITKYRNNEAVACTYGGQLLRITSGSICNISHF